MSQGKARVSSLILQETFGDLVEKVGKYLIDNGAPTLADIAKGLHMKKADVKKCLLVLLQHHLVSYSTHKSNTLIYRAELSAILGRVRYPRHIHTGKDVAGDIGEMIVEDIVQHGQSMMSQCITRVTQRLREGGTKHDRIEEQVKQKFEKLVESHLIYRVRSPSLETTPTVSVQSIPTAERYIIPHISVVQLTNRKRGHSPKGDDTDEPAAKKSKSDRVEEDDSPDSDILWFLNIEQFQRYYRNKAIVQAVGEKVDPTSSIIIRALIKVSQKALHIEEPLYSGNGPSASVIQIMEGLPDNLHLQKEELVQYLSLLVEEQFLLKTDDAGGGSYCVNYKSASNLLCQSVLESVVCERFGSKPLRLFRLLLLKKHLEQKQISDMALIPNKEAKEMLYSLLAENFISLQEIPRSSDYAPSRTFYLFSVNKNQVARVVLQRCYKALGNLMTKRKHVATENRRLLEKYAQWERQQASQGEDEVEIEEAITPTEREAAEKVKLNIEKLEQGELQLDSTIICIEDYLGFVSFVK